MSVMSTTEREKLNEKLTAITANHTAELKCEAMEVCGFKLINHDKNTADLTLVTEESSNSVFAFMYKVFGEDPFLTK